MTTPTPKTTKTEQATFNLRCPADYILPGTPPHGSLFFRHRLSRRAPTRLTRARAQRPLAVLCHHRRAARSVVRRRLLARAEVEEPPPLDVQW